jgi:hypothetical protein
MQTLLLSLLFSLIGLVPVFAQTTVADYLRANHAPFVLTGSANVALFDSAFYANDVFMLGENHGYAVPQTLDLVLLKHLNERVGLRYYMAEMDVAQAELVNQYLNTGNTVTLDSLFRGFLAQTMAGTSQWGNRQFYDKIVAIRAYNQTRPDSLRIRFLGVDWFSSKGRFIPDLMRSLLNPNAATFPADGLLDSLRLVVNQPDVSLGKLVPFADRIRADYQANRAKYTARFGTRLTPFRQVFELLSYANLGITRDQVAARQVQFLTTEMQLQREKLYGLWGYTHVLGAGINNSSTLSGLLKKAGRKVVTMPIMFKDSRMLVHRDHVPFMFRKAGQEFVEMTYLNADGPIFGIDGFSELLPVTQSQQTTLIKLNAPDSPYSQSQKLVKVGGMTGTKIKPDNEQTVTVDYFQYVFVVRDSPAVSLWSVASPD